MRVYREIEDHAFIVFAEDLDAEEVAGFLAAERAGKVFVIFDVHASGIK